MVPISGGAARPDDPRVLFHGHCARHGKAESDDVGFLRLLFGKCAVVCGPRILDDPSGMGACDCLWPTDYHDVFRCGVLAALFGARSERIRPLRLASPGVLLRLRSRSRRSRAHGSICLVYRCALFAPGSRHTGQSPYDPHRFGGGDALVYDGAKRTRALRVGRFRNYLRRRCKRGAQRLRRKYFTI